MALGAHLCECGSFVYLPPMLLKAGFSEQVVSGLLGCGPFLCLLCVPAVGAWSDACGSALGRRRPFLLAFGLLLLCALAAVALSDTFSPGENRRTLLASATVLIDFATQATLNPCQALVSDLVPSSQLGFAVYSFMLSLGGVLGYLLTSLDWTFLGTAAQERSVFLLLMVVYGLCLASSFVLARETPLAKTASDDALSIGVTVHCLQKDHPGTPSHKRRGLVQQLRHRRWQKLCGEACFMSVVMFVCDAFCQVFVSLPARIAHWLHLAHVLRVPRVLKRLFAFQLVGWMAVMSHYLYFTDFTGEVIYSGKAGVTASVSSLALYDRGVRAGSWGLLLNCVVASLYSLVAQRRVTSRLGQRAGLVLGMASFAVAMLGLVVVRDVPTVLLLSGLAGIASPVLDSIPYSLACHYCLHGQEYFQDCKSKHGIGECLAVLDAAEYLSQVLLSLFMGYMFYVTGTVASYVLVAAACALAACYGTSFVVCPSTDRAQAEELSGRHCYSNSNVCTN